MTVARVLLIVLVLAVPLAAMWGALDMQEQSALDAELRPSVYAVDEPVPTTTAAVPTPTGDVRPVASTATVSPRVAGPVAVVVALAERGEAIQVTATEPPPLPVGLNGLPLAPTGMFDCDVARFYRSQFGLPAHFDGLAWRESGCQPGASNWCCSGLWQIHKLWVGQLAKCGVFVRDDLYDPQRNACAAAHVYAVQGGEAWSAW